MPLLWARTAPRRPSVARGLPALVAVAALSLGGVVLAAPALAAPVKCAAGDLTPDGRVFPEPRVSVSLITLAEFECGALLLEQQLPRPDRRDHARDRRAAAGRSTTSCSPTRRVLPVAEAAAAHRLLDPRQRAGRPRGRRCGCSRTWSTPGSRRREPYVAAGARRGSRCTSSSPTPTAGRRVTCYGGTYASGIPATRGNDSRRRPQPQLPGHAATSARRTRPCRSRSRQALDALLSQPRRRWYLGTDNHGQGADTYGAAGLQIVGQFDFQKSETLARYADAISRRLRARSPCSPRLQAIGGRDRGGRRRLPLGDALRHARLLRLGLADRLLQHRRRPRTAPGTRPSSPPASTSTTRLTAAAGRRSGWTRSGRSTSRCSQQALVEERFTFPVGWPRRPTSSTRRVVTDSRRRRAHVPAAGRDAPAAAVLGHPDDVLHRPQRLRVVPPARRRCGCRDIARRPDACSTASTPWSSPTTAMPEPGDAGGRTSRTLSAWVRQGGNLVVTDAAAPALAALGLVASGDVTHAPSATSATSTSPTATSR